MKRRILTPAAYEAAFKEGKAAGLAHGLTAISPYLNLMPTDAYDKAQAAAWEMGWWSVCEKLVDRVRRDEPDRATSRYWIAVAVVGLRSIGARLRGRK